MSIKEIIEFTDFMWFYDKYKPLTPYGNENKNALNFYCDHQVLEQCYSATENILNVCEQNEDIIIKLEHHLSKIDKLNNLDAEQFDIADIFLIKKLLLNYKYICEVLDRANSPALSYQFNSEGLLQTLSPNNDFSETFYLSSAFSDQLGLVRKQIKNTDKELNNIKQSINIKLNEQFQIDFSHREFVLIDNKRINELKSELLNVEFYDDHMVKVKPIYPTEYTTALIKREGLLIDEAEFEKQVLLDLSYSIKVEISKIKEYISSIEALDISIARARLAQKYNLTKPNLSSNKIHIEEGVYLPLQDKQATSGMQYTPLNASFKNQAILLSGSNMGGKTVLFKTIGFMQLMAQMGFFVPAKKFESQVFNDIRVLGLAHIKNTEGLSSFGQEIHKLSLAINQNNSMLLLVDELAKTTNATEAKAILYAVLKHIAQQKKITGLFSTHFINIPNIDGLGKYRMKGLNKDEYFHHHQNITPENIQEKIKLINTFMQYEVEEDNGKANAYDALTIAKLLGLNTKIIKEANDYLETRYD